MLGKPLTAVVPLAQPGRAAALLSECHRSHSIAGPSWPSVGVSRQRETVFFKESHQFGLVAVFVVWSLSA